jgi:peroxiredoxin
MAYRTTQELDSARRHFRDEVIPARALAIMDADTRRLADSGLYRSSRLRRKRVQDFILPDVQGRPVRLYSLLEAGPVVVTFYRGGWCPYCNIALRGLQRELPRIQQYGARLAAISPQLPDQSLSTAEQNALEFPVLSDVGNHVARQFGLTFKISDPLRDLYREFNHALDDVNGTEGGNELPIPATLLISTDRTMLHAFVDADYTKRMDPEDIIAALAKSRTAIGV